MTVFDSRLAPPAGAVGEHQDAPRETAGHVGWVAAFVWPAVSTAVVAGALLGAEGRVFLWAGIVGGVAMSARQIGRLVARKVRLAGTVIDNAPGGRLDR